MRLFLAINLDPATRHSVYAAAAPLRAAAPDLGWIDADRLHVTLKFLGEQTEDMGGRVVAAMDGVSRRHRWVQSDLHEFGAFPNLRRARVVFMGMGHDPRHEMLHHDVEIACRDLGFPAEGRPFRPHVTLARVRRPLSRDAVRALRKAMENEAGEPVPVTVRSIDLMHSMLRPAGPSYNLVHASPLRES